MSLVTDILDRLSGVASLKEKISQQDRVIEGMQRIMLDQQRDISELKGTLKAMIAMRPESKRLK
ncbi:MAG: hypothetical protein HZA59_12545 [Hydrogenophilales bacterium]|nr:hypothetical protein [Hydrogenophilales bacterium]